MKRVQGKKRVFQDWKVEQLVTQKYKKNLSKKREREKKKSYIKGKEEKFSAVRENRCKVTRRGKKKIYSDKISTNE